MHWQPTKPLTLSEKKCLQISYGVVFFTSLFFLYLPYPHGLPQKPPMSEENFQVEFYEPTPAPLTSLKGKKAPPPAHLKSLHTYTPLATPFHPSLHGTSQSPSSPLPTNTIQEEDPETNEDLDSADTDFDAANHGPIALFTPSPVIPEHLQTEELQTSIIIEFFISSGGSVQPRIIKSTGNFDLDQSALATAKKWIFQPAKKKTQPIDAMIKARIQFEVK